MTGKGGDKEGGKTGRGERQGRGTDRGGEKGRQGRQRGRGNREGGGPDREGGQTGRGDIHRGRHLLPLISGGLVCCLSAGGCLCQHCPSRRGHCHHLGSRHCHLAWASSYVGGASSSRWVLVLCCICGWCSVIVCECQVVVCGPHCC